MLVRSQVQGYIEQVGTCTGFYPDGLTAWTAPTMAIRLRTLRPLRSLAVHGYVPGGRPRSVAVVVDGTVLGELRLAEEGVFILDAKYHQSAGSEFDLEIRCDEVRLDGDDRPLGIVLLRVVAEHDALI